MSGTNFPLNWRALFRSPIVSSEPEVGASRVAETLGRMFLLQNAIQAAPDERGICETLSHGLIGVPGIGGAAVCLEGKLVGSTLRPGSFRCPGYDAGEGRCSMDCPVGKVPGFLLLRLQAGRRTHGCLVLETTSREGLEPFEPAVRGAVAFAALRMANERILHEREERFRALIEKSSDMILVFDGEARLEFWSSSATEALGWSAEELRGRTPWVEGHIHPEDVDLVAESYRSVVQHPGSSGRVTFRHRHKNGSWRTVEAIARNMLGDPAVRGVVVNARDVTVQRHLEEKFQQAQRLESVGRLAGGLAHDFNNLLTVILSCAEGLEHDRGRGLVTNAEDVEQIRIAAERARDLTRQLLAFARKQTVTPVAVDLGAVVRNSEKLLLRLLGEDVRLVVRTKPDPWPTLCDPGQIEQVLMNLAVNARDAMPAGGTLTIETFDAHGHRLAPEERGVERGAQGWVCLSVRDTGEGMTAEAKEHLYEPFYTTKAHGKGTGLGLATVHGIVTQSGGHIEVESELGRGTTFRVYLPRTEAPVQSAPAQGVAASRRGVETVMVIEDDPQVRSVAVRALQEAGYRVLVASGGEEALEIAGRADALDLVLTDVVMPGRSGPRVVDELRRVRPGLEVLYASGYERDLVAEHGVLVTGDDFLPKPFTASALLERVRARLDR